MLPFGFMAFEQVYRLDAQGRLRLRKLAPRMPRTIKAMHVEPDGGLRALEQWPARAGEQGPVLGVDRLVVYVHEREAGDWMGTSVLRPAYKNWLLKDPTLRVWSQAIDRNGMGVPVYEGAEGETDLSKGQAIAQGYRSGSDRRRCDAERREAARSAASRATCPTLSPPSATRTSRSPGRCWRTS